MMPKAIIERTSAVTNIVWYPHILTYPPPNSGAINMKGPIRVFDMPI